LGPAKFALGIAIERDHVEKSVSISQTAFIDRIVDRFNQTDAHPVDTTTFRHVFSVIKL
jgi:hypothetical protein